ncbi:cupin domain-containing protein [Erwinia sp. E602]|uniref:cupin domain-containing protein n=1 Tax=Erwinia sp. E602 TaxID=2675378 RepID=UPI001BABBC97|nr:cupin domain-containing protein [Erwinia sp. E602]QUG74975.1 cupin domain-containing protein [Erwinia sp. E602]
MIDIAEFTTLNAKTDPAVNIAISRLISKQGINACGSEIKRGHRIGCHSHTVGEEWYIVLSGEGEIWTADVKGQQLHKKRVNPVKAGSVFCIYPSTAHQMRAITDLSFLFLCPESHVSSDRTLFDDLIDPVCL